MILALVNNKGGVAKTTTAVNLAAAFARGGKRTLLVDLDGQASTSLALGVSRTSLTPSSAAVLLEGVPVASCIRSTSTEGLDLVTGSMELANADLVLGGQRGRERVLADKLAPVRASYDFIVLDCPPSLGLLPINALVASDGFLVPVMPHYLALEGLVNLLEAVERLRNGMGLTTKLLGLVITLADYRLRSTAEITGMLREHYGSAVCGPEIRVNAPLAVAPSHGKHIFDHDPGAPGADAYAMLAREVFGRCREGGWVEGRMDGKTERRKSTKTERRAA